MIKYESRKIQIQDLILNSHKTHPISCIYKWSVVCFVGISGKTGRVVTGLEGTCPVLFAVAVYVCDVGHGTKFSTGF